MVKICHASIDEKGNVAGGQAGDQTQKEVCVRDWYDKQWNVHLRYKDKDIAKKASSIAKKLANSELVGYDQYNRNTLYQKLKKHKWNVEAYIASKEQSECDCSAFVYAIYCCLIPSMRGDSNAPTTSTMKAFFKKHGFEVSTAAKFTDKDNYLLTGDVLVKEGSHTVMAVSDGAKATTKEKKTCPYKEPTTTVKRGQTGNSVKWAQWHLIESGFMSAKNHKGKSNLDGDFGTITEAAVKAFQKKYPACGTNSKPDGVIGKKSKEKLKNLVK